MTINYTSLRATAQQLLQQFGDTASLTRNTGGAYDPSTGTGSVTTTVDSVIAVVLDYPTKLVDGTLVHQDDKMAYVAANVSVPKPTDSLTWQGVSYDVITVKNLAPAGISVVYELQVRR